MQILEEKPFEKKKPFINETKREKRLKFSKAYASKPMKFLKNVIFSDESKFNIFGLGSMKTVWRKAKYFSSNQEL